MTKFSEKIEQIKSAATLAGLKINHVTGAFNGYPEPETGIAITGFSTFAECAEFCKINGGIEANFESKAGWQMVNYKGEAYSEFSIEDQSNDWKNYNIVDSVQEFQNDLFEFIQNMTIQGSSCDNTEDMEAVFESINDFINQGQKTSSRVDVIVAGGGVAVIENFEIVEEIYPTMAYNYDNTRYEVGVYFNYLDIREALESDSE